MNVRVVPFRDIQKTLSEPWVDKTRKPYVLNDTAFIPVLDGHPYTQSLPERKRKNRGFQRIGDIIAFHGTDRPGQELVEELNRTHSPRGIIWYTGHQGKMRIPEIVILDGEIGEVLHREAGISYKLDPSHVMFSQGNREEKNRISGFVTSGEHVCDMFAGIGYFTLPLAMAGARVHAIELNPESVRYLKINCIDNNLKTRVTITNGDCRKNMAGTYDRIQMGHYDAIEFLPSALKHVTSGTVLHIHGIGDITKRIAHILLDFNLKGSLNLRTVKTIGPGKNHTVTDVVIV